MFKKLKLPISRRRKLAGAKRAFFKAMVVAYVSDGVRDYDDPTVEKPYRRTFGSVTAFLVRVDQDYVVMWEESNDYYYADGKVIIFFQGKPVWMMTYGGSYPERVISFLKSALRLTYVLKIFVGGRGPCSLTDGDLTYENVVTEVGSVGGFGHFFGRERIVEMVGGYKKEIGFTEFEK